MAKECMTCLNKVSPQEKGATKCTLSDVGTIFSCVNYRPSTKAHTVVYTKRHTEDLRSLTSQEWADILPCLKESIAKIDRVYHPLGYRISMPNGKAAGQDQPAHSYTRLVPKYKKYYSNTGVPASEKEPLPPEFSERKKKLQEALKPNSDKVIAEKSRITAKLLDEGEIIPFSKETLTGSISISTKAHLPNDIQAIDQETWQEIGEMLKELIGLMEKNKIDSGFSVTMTLGKEAIKTWKEEAELPADHPYPDSELIINLIPVYDKKVLWIKENRKVNKPYKIISAFENERIAEKLNNPEEYAKIWGKKSPKHEEEIDSQTKTLPSETIEKNKSENIWKQPSTYLMFVSGFILASLIGLGIYWILSRKKNSKQV